MPASTSRTRRTLLRSTGALAGAALVHRYAADLWAVQALLHGRDGLLLVDNLVL